HAALSSLRPDLMFFSQRTNLDDTEFLEEYIRLSRQYADVPETGRWRGEWDYRVNGMGILLTHTTTREPIEWDAPDTQRFDRFWFLNFVEWHLSHSADDEAVYVVRNSVRQYNGKLREFTFEALYELQNRGAIIRCDNLNRYILLPVDDNWA